MSDDQDFWTADAMLKYGGSFVKILGSLCYAADPDNFQRIKNTWPEYWTTYEKMGQEMKAREK